MFGLPVHGMFGRVETVNKAIFAIELNPLQSVVKSGRQALHTLMLPSISSKSLELV